MTMQPSERKQRNRLLGWIALGLFAIIGLVVVVIEVCKARKPLHAVAYYEGNPDINTQAAVLFRKGVVGGIDSIHGGVRCVQLLLHRRDDDDWMEAVTIELDASRRIGDQGTGIFTVAYHGDVITIAAGDAPDSNVILTIVRDHEGDRWWLTPVDAATPIELEHQSLDRKRALLVPSNDIGIGNGLLVRWNEPAIHACVFLNLDTAEIHKLANLPDVPISAVVGTLSTGFALARPGIRLTLPPVGNSVSLVRGGAREIVPDQDIDIYAVLNRVGSYLTDPRKMHSPPRGRAEQVVYDLNNSLQHADSTIVTIDAATSELQRLMADLGSNGRPAATRTGRMVDEINMAVGNVRVSLGKIDHTVDELRVTVSGVNGQTLPKVNMTVDELADAADNLNIALQKLGQLTERLRTGTLPRVESTLDQNSPALRQALEQVRKAASSLQNAADGIDDFLP